MTTARAAAEAVPAAKGAPSARWWVIAGGLLAIGLMLVVGFAIIRSSDGRLADTAAPIIVDGADLTPIQGRAHKDGPALVIEAAGADGVAVLSAGITPFAAEEFDHVEWTVAAAQAPDLAFIWRTRENPRRTHSKRLRWLVSGAAPLALTPADGWSGTITGVGLVSSVATPVRVRALRIAAPSALLAAQGLARQWTAPNPLRGYSVNYPFDAERGHDLPAAVAIAAGEALAIVLYLALGHRRGWRRDPRVLWGIFLGGWLLLDLRWQTNLWREAAARALEFAGKSTAEMHLAAPDAALYAAMERVKRALPATPVRVFLYCDNDNLCARAAFLLYPQNVYRAVNRRRTLPAPEELHEGDHLLLFYSRAMAYDRARQVAVWPDGKTKPADELLLETGALMLRIR